MQPYGLPCAFSTEKEVRSKTPRRAASVAVEVNSEGVTQLDGLATRGMTMFCGPNTNERQMTVVSANSTPVLTAPQLVDGILFVSTNTDAVAADIVLPSVTSVNAFLNSNLISEASGNLAVAASAPRTSFKCTLICQHVVNFVTPATTPAGHVALQSGYSSLTIPALGAGNITVTPLGLSASVQVGSPAARRVYEIYFVQTLGSNPDPEWVIIPNA